MWIEKRSYINRFTRTLRELRYRIQKKINEILALYKRFNVGFPAGLENSIEEYLRANKSDSKIRTLREAYEYNCSPLNSDDGNIKKELDDYCKNFNLPSFQLAELNNVHLRSRNFYLIDSKREKIFLQSVNDEKRINHILGGEAFKKFKTNKKEGAYFLGFDRFSEKYYYHWMIEALPRFLALDYLPEDVKIIMPRKISDYAMATLKLMGIDQNRCVYFDNQDWELETCYFATKPYGWMFSSETEIKEVAKRLKDNVDRKKDVNYPKKFYVSRAKCKWRVLPNQDEIEDYLTERGYTVIYAEDHSMEEKISIFRNATDIVANDGGGCSNLIFCEPGTKVTMIYDKDMYDSSMWVLCNCFKLKMNSTSHFKGEALDIEKLESVL